jgi:hypothetical protein
MVQRPSGLAKPIRRYLNGWELWASSQFQERTPAGGDIGGRATKPNTPKDTLASNLGVTSGGSCSQDWLLASSVSSA